ncbi:MAG: type II CAAX endopeptidase family protein [Acidimicrobiia bacterium]|nr:type II CAAX endopeptidase family protein [Acidimicrobiia bacterium]
MNRTDAYLPASVWTFWDAAGLFFGGLVGSVVAIALGIALNGGEELGQVTLLLVSSLGQAVVTFGLLAYMSRVRGSGSWDLDFGFRFERSDWRGLLYGMGLQLAVTLLVLLPMAYLLGIEDPPQQDVADIAADASGMFARLGILVVLVVIAPIAEEVVFRGVLLSRLRRGMGPTGSIAISAALFSGIHLIDPDAVFVVPGLFIIGIVLGWQALRTGRIGLAIATHAGVNLLAAIALLLNLEV